jgi:hypothetical protein
MILSAIPDLIPKAHIWTFILAGIAVSSLFNAWQPVAQAMAADMSGDDTVETRNIYMSALTLSEKSGNLVGFSLGYYMLTLVLEDYLPVWIIFTSGCTIVFIGCVFLLEETRDMTKDTDETDNNSSSKRHDKSDDSPGIFISVWRDLKHGLFVIFQDPFLVGFLFVNFLAYLSMAGAIVCIGSYLLIVLDYTQAVASLAGIVQQFPIIAGIYLGVSLQNHFAWAGPYSNEAVGLATGDTPLYSMHSSIHYALAILYALHIHYALTIHHTLYTMH